MLVEINAHFNCENLMWLRYVIAPHARKEIYFWRKRSRALANFFPTELYFSTALCYNYCTVQRKLRNSQFQISPNMTEGYNIFIFGIRFVQICVRLSKLLFRIINRLPVSFLQQLMHLFSGIAGILCERGRHESTRIAGASISPWTHYALRQPPMSNPSNVEPLPRQT